MLIPTGDLSTHVEMEAPVDNAVPFPNTSADNKRMNGEDGRMGGRMITHTCSVEPLSKAGDGERGGEGQRFFKQPQQTAE